MTGWIPFPRHARRSSSVCLRTPENPFARQFARSSMTARTAVRGKRRARAGRVAPDEVELERAELLPRDDDVGELPEPRRDAVDDPVLGDGAVDDGARRVHARGRARREDGGRLAAGDGRKIFE